MMTIALQFDKVYLLLNYVYGNTKYMYWVTTSTKIGSISQTPIRYKDIKGQVNTDIKMLHRKAEKSEKQIGER